MVIFKQKTIWIGTLQNSLVSVYVFANQNLLESEEAELKDIMSLISPN